jgi:cyclophilin family peptidyl-prolyl cis-trans isomerase
VKYGIIQGGDPLSKDPSKAASVRHRGMNALKGEINAEPMTAGAVAAALVPGRPDSGGAQFFVCVTDQPTLQGQFTIFGRVVEGLDLVQKISGGQCRRAGAGPAERIVIKSVTIRDTPPPVKEPFIDATPAELARHHIVLETTKGEIELEFMTDKAPETTRQVLRLAASGRVRRHAVSSRGAELRDSDRRPGVSRSARVAGAGRAREKPAAGSFQTRRMRRASCHGAR